MENAQKEVETPFKFEDEQKQKSGRLDELNTQLNMDEKGGEIIEMDMDDKVQDVQDKEKGEDMERQI